MQAGYVAESPQPGRKMFIFDPDEGFSRLLSIAFEDFTRFKHLVDKPKLK